jgi:hypothetical protein
MRKRLGWWLRCAADRIDPAHAFRASSYRFTFERNRGVDVHLEAYGCRYWYLTQDYDKAHSEAKNPV